MKPLILSIIALTLYNYHSDETAHFQMKDSEKISHFFRSRSDNKTFPIEPKLIQILEQIENHFGVDTIELISGYRSPELNATLKKSGDKVAMESLHMEGKAADIHIDEITEEAIVKYARSLKAGGVGFYPAQDFVHIDVGDLRTWSMPDKPGRDLIGFKKGSEWEIVTDKNIYLPNEKIIFNLNSLTTSREAPRKCPQIEHFKRGKWAILSLTTCTLGKNILPVNHLPFGKFRIRIEGPKEFPYLDTLSNEFYRKKL